MMYGIGCDIVKTSRISRIQTRWGMRFLRKALHPKEIIEFEKRKGNHAIQYLAGRWCAKEATHKAFGGFRIPFPDIVVTNDSKGKPSICFEGKAAQLAVILRIGAAHVSISHEEEYAVANVLLEKISNNSYNTL